MLPNKNHIFYIIWFYMTAVYAQNLSIVVDVIVNEEAQGQEFLALTEEGDVLVPAQFLEKLRLKPEIWQQQPNTKAISLRALSPVVQFTIDQGSATLKLDVAPEFFEKQEFNLNDPRAAFKGHDIIPNAPFSAFLNYGIDGNFLDDHLQGFNVPWEFGITVGQWLLEGGFSHQYAEATKTWRTTRTRTSLTWDNLPTLQRIILGDFSAPATYLTSGGTFGGISLSKNFSLDPYFIRYPSHDFSGLVQTPSDVEIYVNGNLLNKRHVQPGPIDFLNVFNRTGEGTVDVVIRDAFGREQRFNNFINTGYRLLKTGVDEYSYNLGFRRDQQSQNKYNHQLTLIGFHRYGFTNTFTAGLTFEGNEEVTNLGGNLNMSLGKIGQFDGGTNFSKTADHSGYGLYANYNYTPDPLHNSLSFFAGITSYSRYYANLQTQYNINNSKETVASQTPHYQGMAQINYNMGTTAGSLALTHSRSRNWESEKIASTTSLSYSNSLFNNWNFAVTASHGVDAQNKTDNRILLMLLYTPKSKQGKKQLFDQFAYRGQTNHEKSKNSNEISTVEHDFTAQSYSTGGTGYNYMLNAHQKQGGESTATGRFQYRGNRGIYAIDYTKNFESSSNFRLNMAGGIGLVDGTIRLGRPIYDSFALVKTPNMPNTSVRLSGQAMGTTDATGNLLLAEVVSHTENTISIDPEDLGISKSVDKQNKYLKPMQRGGSMVSFAVTKFTAAEGNLYLKTPTGEKPLTMLPIEYEVNGQKKESFVAQEGYFYLENLLTGQNKIRVLRQQGNCMAIVDIPETEKIVVNVGKVACVPES